MEEMWDDIPRQLWRSTRKRLGFAASADVGILVNLLRSLYRTALSRVSETRPPVVVSYPGLVALYSEDIHDAMEYLDIRALSGHHLYSPREMVAAYAGHGLGLCENYKDKEICCSEGLEMPVKRTILVEYTKASLLIHYTTMREAHDLANPDIRAFAAFDLGSDAVESPTYHDRVRNSILDLLRREHTHSSPPDVITIIVTGESGSDGAMANLLEAAVVEFGSKASLLMRGPEFVAARGAAELAWRA